MTLLNCTLLTDGSSDVALLPILEWAIRQHVGEIAVQCEWADLRRLRLQPRGLGARIVKAVELYPCDMLFVHRDAEGQDPGHRYEEINAAVRVAADLGFNLPYVCVVPVRMQEAWLLLDPVAIRSAADNPNGKAQLNLPPPRRIEAHPDPKEVLYQALKAASELSGRRLKRYRPEQRAHSVPRYMTDFGVLRQLPAFVRMEEDIRIVVERMNGGV
jgi:hypothetical protein